MRWNRYATAGVVVATAVGLGGLGAVWLGSDHAVRPLSTGGPQVRIAVVPPVERALQPGEIMDVGEVVDGYEHRTYVRPDEEQIERYLEPEIDEPVRTPVSRTVGESALATAPAEAKPLGRPLSFGFDQPRPDYAAARRERMARMEDQRRIEEERRLYRSDGDRSERRGNQGGDRYPESDRRDERQWYRSDGTPVPGPETFY